MTLATVPDVRLRAAVPSDEHLIRSLFAGARDDLFLLDPNVRDALLDMQYRAQRRQLVQQFPNAEQFVVMEDGVAVGLLVQAATAVGLRLIHLVVNPARRGRGVARSVLEAVLCGQPRVIMSVSTRDTAVRSLLESAGFDQGSSESAGEVTLTWNCAA